MVLVEVIYNIGFRVEPKGRTGFAHLFEHMMFQGSGQLKKLEHIQYVSRSGGVLNGSTRFDYTNYFEVVPSNALDQTLWLEADRMRSLDLSPENLKNQQNVVSEEVRVNVLNQPHGGFEWLDLWEKANSNWHNAHNFYGDLSELEAATLDDVRAFFKTYYAPNNAVLVVVGDTTAAEVRALAEKHFGSIPRGTPPPPADVSEPPQTAEKRATRDDKLARTPALALGWHLPARMSKDFFALAVLDPLIVGDQSARLHQKLVRETRQATAVAGAFNLLGSNWDMKGPMLYTVRVDYRPDTTADKVIAAVDEVLADIQHARHHRHRAGQRQAGAALGVLRGPRSRRPAALRPRQPARHLRPLRRRPRPHQHHPHLARRGHPRRRQGGGRPLVRRHQSHHARQPSG